MPKIQNLKFHNSLYNFGRDLPRSMHEFLGTNLFCIFRQDAFEFFSAIWSHVNENKKKNLQNLKFPQSLYNFGGDPP